MEIPWWRDYQQVLGLYGLLSYLARVAASWHFRPISRRVRRTAPKRALAAEDAPPKRTWNSLEVAKLIVSTGTAVAIAVIGGMLTYQASQERIAEDNRKSLAESQEKRAVADQEERIRIAAEARDDALRKDAREREDTLRIAAEEREASLKREALARDREARDQAIETARLSKLIEKRIEIWDQVYPKLTKLYLAVEDEEKLASVEDQQLREGLKSLDEEFRTAIGDDPAMTMDQIDSAATECWKVYASGLPYFSGTLTKAMREYIRFVYLRDPRKESDKPFGRNRRLYERLLSAATEDLALSRRSLRTPPLPMQVRPEPRR